MKKRIIRKKEEKEFVIVLTIAGVLILIALLVILATLQYPRPTIPSRDLDAELGSISPWAEENISKTVCLNKECGYSLFEISCGTCSSEEVCDNWKCIEGESYCYDNMADGLTYYFPNEVSWGNESGAGNSRDYCEDENYLMEAYCPSETNYSGTYADYFRYKCEYGCSENIPGVEGEGGCWSAGRSCINLDNQTIDKTEELKQQEKVIHFIEGARIKENEYVIVGEGDSYKILRVVEITQNYTNYSNSRIILQDALTEETYNADFSNYARIRVNVTIQGEIYYIYYKYSSNSSRNWIRLTWGGGAEADYAPYGVGNEISVACISEEPLFKSIAKNDAIPVRTLMVSEKIEDFVSLSTESKKLYFMEPINFARTTITSGELPVILADGEVTDMTGEIYAYTQTITLGDTVSKFGTSGGDLPDPGLYLDVGTNAEDPLYNYTVLFSESIDVSDPNVQGSEIILMGKRYTIEEGSTNSTIYLNEARGLGKLKLQNAATVKSGADETSIKSTKAIIHTNGNLFSGFTTQVAMNTSIKDHISIGEDFVDPVFEGLSVQFTNTFPNLDLYGSSRARIIVDTDNNQYGYVTFTSARAGSAGEQRITYVYDNDTSSVGVQPLLAHQTITTANKGHIHVVEGEDAQETDWIVINQGDAGTILEVIDMSADTATSGYVSFQDVITGDEQKITVTNATNEGYKKTGVNFFGGNGYTVRMDYAGTKVNITWNSGATAVFPRIKLKEGGWIAFLTKTTVTNGTSVIFPDGATTLATSGTVVTNATGTVSQNGITWGKVEGTTSSVIQNLTVTSSQCNFSTGPAVLFIEPKKWDDATYGNYICIPMASTGSTEISIDDAVFNGTNSGFVTLNSDVYKKQAVDQYGTLVTKEDRTNENGVVTISYPKSQMYLNVAFTAEGITTSPTSSGGGSVEKLGSVTKYDNEVSSVQTKNLIVVGGSCINSVAAKVLDVSEGTCGAAFTSATGVGANQFLIKVVDSPYTTGQVAMLVAGYEAADTTKAVEYVTKENPATDIGTELKKVTATYADVTSTATEETSNATAE